MFIKKDEISVPKFQIMDEKGTILEKERFALIEEKVLIEGLKRILFARTVDLQIVSYQRQGRMYTYPPNIGQEAIAVAAGMVLEKEDWLVPAYREMAAWLAKGVTLFELFQYWGGHDQGMALKQAHNMLPVSIPIASQLLHATGIGYAIKLKKQKNVVIAFCGDGGTSEGDFHEALNFASVWKVPVIFIVQNNGYAISCPFTRQTGAQNVALKSVAYGITGLQVDGNDFSAMYTSLKEVVGRARKGEGPFLLEAVTYRLGAHTTSDDPSKYRSIEEEKQWQEKDPLKRLSMYLTKKKKWSAQQEEKLVQQYKKKIEKDFKEFESSKSYDVHDCFNHLYSEIPEDLKAQQTHYEQFLQAKGVQK